MKYAGEENSRSFDLAVVKIKEERVHRAVRILAALVTARADAASDILLTLVDEMLLMLFSVKGPDRLSWHRKNLRFFAKEKHFPGSLCGRKGRGQKISYLVSTFPSRAMVEPRSFCQRVP